MGLINRLVQGPTLSGQLHRDGACRVLTVRLAGRLGNRSWRIEDRAVRTDGADATWRPAAELADEVAYRVFTELTIGRSVRWEALREFAAGVRAYRRSLNLARERRLNLREAERKLIAAHAEDQHFDLAYYNLGVVYTELGELDAAASAFEHARDQNPARWSTHYALAVTHLQRAQAAFNANRSETALLQLSNARDHCEEARRLAPDAATAAQIILANRAGAGGLA
jgi:tetratricopeptide (TPR) repeat protein